MKGLFLAIILFTSSQIFGQKWFDDEVIDTLRNSNGKIKRLINRENSEEITFTYDTEGLIVKKRYTFWKGKTQYEKVTEYYKDGSPQKEFFFKLIDKKIFGVLKIDSTYTEFYKNEVIKEIRFYKKAKLNGKSTLFYPNGNKEAELFYIDDKLMSVLSFDINGKILENEGFKNGSGKLIFYKEGVPSSICDYRNGKVLKKTCNCY